MVEFFAQHIKNPPNPKTRIEGDICVQKYHQILFFYLAELGLLI